MDRPVGVRQGNSIRWIQSVAHVRSIIRRLDAKEITSEQAIRLASSDGRHSDLIPQLQGNFAFTKAYLAERSGSGGGLPGANFYVDLALFENRSAEWIELGKTIKWSDPALQLSAEFAQVYAIEYSALTKVPSGLRTGVGVAQDLAPSHDVIQALHAVELASKRRPK